MSIHQDVEGYLSSGESTVQTNGLPVLQVEPWSFIRISVVNGPHHEVYGELVSKRLGGGQLVRANYGPDWTKQQSPQAPLLFVEAPVAGPVVYSKSRKLAPVHAGQDVILEWPWLGYDQFRLPPSILGVTMGGTIRWIRKTPLGPLAGVLCHPLNLWTLNRKGPRRWWFWSRDDPSSRAYTKTVRYEYAGRIYVAASSEPTPQIISSAMEYAAKGAGIGSFAWTPTHLRHDQYRKVGGEFAVMAGNRRDLNIKTTDANHYDAAWGCRRKNSSFPLAFNAPIAARHPPGGGQMSMTGARLGTSSFQPTDQEVPLACLRPCARPYGVLGEGWKPSAFCDPGWARYPMWKRAFFQAMDSHMAQERSRAIMKKALTNKLRNWLGLSAADISFCYRIFSDLDPRPGEVAAQVMGERHSAQWMEWTERHLLTSDGLVDEVEALIPTHMEAVNY